MPTAHYCIVGPMDCPTRIRWNSGGTGEREASAPQEKRPLPDLSVVVGPICDGGVTMHRGIHHVTAIAGSTRRNLGFYSDVLGLRLVKKTVNFDDPASYHFYYGDETGSPGSILTFFPWEHAAPGRLGVGETQETVFRIPEASIGYWTHRLVEKGVAHEALVKRFGETVLPFKDSDGTQLALAAARGIKNEPGWSAGEIPTEHAIRGLHSVSLLLKDAAPTGAILSDVLGFVAGDREGTVQRYRADAGLGAIVDLRSVGDFPRGRQGTGSVHHVAFRAADDADQAKMVRKLGVNARPGSRRIPAYRSAAREVGTKLDQFV